MKHGDKSSSTIDDDTTFDAIGLITSKMNTDYRRFFDETRAASKAVHNIYATLANKEPISSSSLNKVSDRILRMLKRDREKSLFALHALHGDQWWVAIGVETAILAGDYLLSEGKPDREVSDVIIGALFHLMGIPLRGNSLGLKDGSAFEYGCGDTTADHVLSLRNLYKRGQWKPSRVARKILYGSQERLDGQGFPDGIRGSKIPPYTRLVAIISMARCLVRHGGGCIGSTPEEAFTWLHQRPQSFDQVLVIKLRKHFRTHPIGSLVSYESGTFGWVLSIQEDGTPSRILALDRDRLSTKTTIMDKDRLDQLGRLDRVISRSERAYQAPSILTLP